MFRNVLNIHTVFSLSLLSYWLLVVFISVLRRMIRIWLRHRMIDRRLRYGIVHRFSFRRMWRRWRNESFASEEQRSSKDWFWCWHLYILILLDYLMRLTVWQLLLFSLLLWIVIRFIWKIRILVEHILLFLTWHWFSINLNDKLNSINNQLKRNSNNSLHDDVWKGILWVALEISIFWILWGNR